MRRMGARMILAVSAATILAPFFASAAGFTRNLYPGMRGDADVARLQDMLRGLGYFNYPASTGNYFTLTVRAVQRFQSSRGITPSGYFGPLSRAAANREATVGALPPASGSDVVVATATATSSYAGKIVISDFSGYSSDPAYERMTLTNTSKIDKVNVSGWRVDNERHGSFYIPLAFALPGTPVIASDPIVLGPGGRVEITLGKQEREMNFRENICTGYFDQTSSFSPSLSHACPRVALPNRSSFTDDCIRLVESASSCRTPQTKQFTDSRCANFINERMTYTACVRDNKDRDDFYLDRWLVWLQRDRDFFRDLTDVVTVFDRQGKVVAVRRY